MNESYNFAMGRYFVSIVVLAWLNTAEAQILPGSAWQTCSLDDAPRHCAVERAAVVVTLARELDEVLDMLGRGIGSELEAEGAEVRGDNGLQPGRRLRQRSGSEDQGEENSAHDPHIMRLRTFRE